MRMMTTPADPLILTVAPNGAYKQATDHPALPLTPEALALIVGGVDLKGGTLKPWYER